MYAVIVRFEVRDGNAGDFQARVTKQAADSLAHEPGCRVFDVWTSAAQPQAVYLYEVYDSRAAFDAHLASAHFTAFDAEVAPMVISKTVDLYDRRLETA